MKNVDALFGKVSTDRYLSISQTPFDHPKFSHFGMNTYSTLVRFLTHPCMRTNRPVQMMFLVLYLM